MTHQYSRDPDIFEGRTIPRATRMGEGPAIAPTLTHAHLYRAAIDKPFIVTNDYMIGKFTDQGFTNVQIYESPPPAKFGDLANVKGANRWAEGLYSGTTMATPTLPSQILALRDDSADIASPPPPKTNTGRNVAIAGAATGLAGILGFTAWLARK